MFVFLPSTLRQSIRPGSEKEEQLGIFAETVWSSKKQQRKQSGFNPNLVRGQQAPIKPELDMSGCFWIRINPHI